MCLDKLKNFRCNKNIGYKIFQYTDVWYSKKVLKSLYHDELYKMETRYYSHRVFIQNYSKGKFNFEYNSGFHAFPTLKDAKIFLNNLDRKHEFPEPLAIGKIKFDNIMTKGIDRNVKCIVVDSMQILAYKLFN